MKLDVIPWNGKYALYFTCNDTKIDYWFERHYDTEKELLVGGLYKTLSGYIEEQDTVISCVYLPEIEIPSPDSYSKARMEIIPVPDSMIAKFRSKRN